MDDGYENADTAPMLREAEAVSDAAAAAKPNAIQRLLMSVGLIHPAAFSVPQISKSDQMILDLQRQLGPPQKWVPPPMLPRSYAVPGAGVMTNVPAASNDPWGEISDLDSKRQAVVDQLGDFSKRVLSSKELIGGE